MTSYPKEIYIINEKKIQYSTTHKRNNLFVIYSFFIVWFLYPGEQEEKDIEAQQTHTLFIYNYSNKIITNIY